VSDNRIDKLDQTYYNTDLGSDQTIQYGNTTLALSPSQIHNLGIESHWFKKHMLLGASFRYVSMQYLDNSQNKNLSLPAFQTLDLQIGFNAQKIARYGLPNMNIRLNNVLNAKYAPSGNTGGFNSIDNNGNRGQQALYFPAASTNVFCTLSWYL
jgi:iron complex outermembrane receptor protein